MDKLYRPQPCAGEWWHYLAAVHDSRNNLYGFQCSMFRFSGIEFSNVALQTVKTRRAEERLHELGSQPVCARQLSHIDHGVNYAFDGMPVALIFEASAEMERYPSDTTTHYGCKRMKVHGSIGKESVQGVGCFDREIFQRFFRPGEGAWRWEIAWLDDGRTLLDYRIGNHRNYRHPIVSDSLGLIEKLEPIASGQNWQRSKLRNFEYTEQLCRVTTAKGTIGLGFQELVGYSGTPDI